MNGHFTGMYITRDIGPTFDRVFQVYDLIAVVGARQAGKTTFLKEHMKTHDASYVLFDDPDARALFDSDVKRFELQYVQGHDLTVLDEAQYCADAGPKLKYLVDSGRRLWITSSSETLLGRAVLSYLVGRVSVLRLYPFSLREFLRAKGVKVLAPQVTERSVWEHMLYGGYPKVVTTDDPELKRTILRDLYGTMLLKDVARTFSIDDVGALERCTNYLAANPGGIMSYSTVGSELNISYQTLRKYLDAMEKSYLITQIRPFFTNRAKELTKQPRVYFLDTGLRNAVAGSFSREPEGHLFENYVLTELVKMGFTPRYWRTKSKAEVDFIVEKDARIIPVEVKLRANPSKIGRSLRSFIATYGPENAMIVGYGSSGTPMTQKNNGCTVHYVDIPGLWKAVGPGMTGFE